MRQLLFLLITLLSGSVLDAVPTPLQVLGPVHQFPPQCADPTYACQDLENARQCGVVTSCINDVWATMSAPEDNEDICSLCKEMVKEARDQLLSNMTQEELKEVFEGSCKLLPIKLVADGCIKLVDEFIPELVEMLASRMDPNMVCTVAGLCNLAHLPIEKHMQNLLHLAALNVKTDKCDQCTAIMTEVKSFVTAMSEADFTQMVIKLCEKEILAPVCEPLVDSYAAQIYQYIVSTAPETICTTAGVCPSSNKIIKVPLENKNVNDDLVCQFCTNVLEHVKEMIIANTTMEEFRTALLNFCTHLGSFSDKCTSLVNDYYDMIFDEIRKMDTKGVCTFIGLCQSGMRTNIITPLVKLFPPETLPKHSKMVRLTPSLPVFRNANSQPLVKLVPAKLLSKKNFRNAAQIESNDIFENAEKFQLPVERLAMPLINIDQNLNCPFCQAVAFFLKKDLGSDRNRDTVKSRIDNVCDKWVTEFPTECKSFLKEYSHRVENHIVENGDFDTLCGLVKACPLKDEDTGVNVRVIPPNPASGDGQICELCKVVFEEAESLVQNPKFQQSLKGLLEKGCEICPAKQKCVNVIGQNIDQLLACIEKNLNSSVACPALHLCPAGSGALVSPSVKDIECDLCKNLIQQLANELQNPQTKSAIQSSLEKGCGLLPQELASQCKTFVDQNVDAIIQLLIGAMNPDVICATLNICPDLDELAKPPKKNDLECELCKEVVQKVEDQLKDEKTEEAIKEALEKVCGYLPTSMFDKCKTFVDTYTDTIITLLLQEMDPSQVCAALNICPETVMPPKNNDLECDLCKEVIQKVLDDIKDDKTEEAIKGALEKVCGYLPSSLQDKCKSFVDTYTETIITLILEEMNPASICVALKMCPETVMPPKNNDLECDLCKEVIQKVLDDIKDDKTEEAIKGALEKVCGYLPSSLQDKCKSFVDTYTETIVTLILEELDPASICVALKMCPESENIKPPINDMECDLCKQVVAMVENQLKDKKTEDAIRNALDKVCSLLPSSVSTRCQAFINTYTELLVSLLVQELDPTMVCAALKVCSTQDVECESCQYLFHFIQDQLANNDTQNELENVLKRVCDIFPEAYAANCNAFVDEYGASLLMLIAQELDPSVMCPKLGMCPSTKIALAKVVQPSKIKSLTFDECQICTTVVDYVDKLLEDDTVDQEITQVVQKVCNIVPASIKGKCTTIIETYGPYILQMIGQIANSKQMCQDIDLCSRPPGHVHLLGGHKCTFGPSYWCQSRPHAAACKAEMYCTQKVWKN